MKLFFINSDLTKFLKGEIETASSNARVKRALQELCAQCRKGGRIQASEVDGLETTIIGAFHRATSDEKVRRWALSAISQVGRPGMCLNVAIQAITAYSHEPQVVSAAIAAIFKLDPRNALTRLSGINSIPREIVFLSGLQIISADKLGTFSSLIDVEKADPVLLKLSLVLVGLNKAPENIFHPKYSNASLVKALGSHDEPIVKQYSAWAVAENPSLSISDLGIDIDQIEGEPENIRSYVFRLYASQAEYSKRQNEIIQCAAYDDSVEARLGAALGLRNTWFDGLDEVTIDWFNREPDEDIKGYLIDHFTIKSNESRVYADLTRREFDCAGDKLQKRILSAASGLGIYKDLRKIEAQKQYGDLWGDIGVSNTFNFNGPVNAGQLTGGGDVRNDGSISIDAKQDNIRLINSTIDEVLRLMKDPNIPAEIADEVKSLAVAAKQEPNKSRLTALAEKMTVLSGITSLVSNIPAIKQLSVSVAGLVGLI